MPIKRIENKNNELIAEFEKAEEAGVVVKDELGYWEIMVTEDFDVEAFMTSSGGYMTGGKEDTNKLNALIDMLETEKEKQKSSAKPLRIECLKANNGSERQVMLDFYLDQKRCIAADLYVNHHNPPQHRNFFIQNQGTDQTNND